MALPLTPFNHVITDYEFLGDIKNEYFPFAHSVHVISPAFAYRPAAHFEHDIADA